MSSDNQGIRFLCGKISRREDCLPRGEIRLRNGESLRVDQSDKGLHVIVPGKRRMVIVKDGEIIAVFGRPRIKLLRMLERGATITQDLIDCYSPMYPKPETYLASLARYSRNRSEVLKRNS